MDIKSATDFLISQVPNPTLGLPDDLFYYISRTTPLINVDLLIKDEKGRTLLTWRDDKYAGKGWHLPGGILRFKEMLEDRIKIVSETEVGAIVRFESQPIAMHQLINREREVRSHFISLLYKCSLPSSFVPLNKDLSPKDAGYAKWHDSCPDDLLKIHEVYRKNI
jgi:ADP-ribose pyrophosphatase YjhB (NUDIX family)